MWVFKLFLLCGCTTCWLVATTRSILWIADCLSVQVQVQFHCVRIGPPSQSSDSPRTWRALSQSRSTIAPLYNVAASGLVNFKVQPHSQMSLSRFGDAWELISSDQNPLRTWWRSTQLKWKAIHWSQLGKFNLSLGNLSPTRHSCQLQ